MRPKKLAIESLERREVFSGSPGLEFGLTHDPVFEDWSTALEVTPDLGRAGFRVTEMQGLTEADLSTFRVRVADAFGLSPEAVDGFEINPILADAISKGITFIPVVE